MDALFRNPDGRTGYKTGMPRSNLMSPDASGTRMNTAMLEDKASNALDWLRNAKDK
jgi:hypothetical protein